jgi:hypothetical protein
VAIAPTDDGAEELEVDLGFLFQSEEEENMEFAPEDDFLSAARHITLDPSSISSAAIDEPGL